MSTHDHTNHALHAVRHMAESLDPFTHGRKKNPALAALMGFVFGCFGVGIYLQSPKDFFVALAIMMALGVLIPGLGIILSLLVLAAYAYARAEASNHKLGYH